MDAVPILYEDDDVIAVDKPEGLVSNARTGDHALLPRIHPARPGRLFVVHRLDKEVSGVLVLAKSAEVHRFLNGAFSRGEVEKSYLALVMGRVEGQRGLVDKPLREFGSGRMAVDEARGRPSRTEYEVRERFGDTTLLQVRPRSGRRHQIRAHLYSIGHAVAGDGRYGAGDAQRSFPRLMLHALSLNLPRRGREGTRIESQLPRSFLDVLAKLR